MKSKLELWQFISQSLERGESVMLLTVAESSGSSPGRAGYKMAVAAGGQLCGSIGGGIMEVNLVEQSRALVSEPGATATGFFPSQLIEQVHKKNSPHSSGMICSGRQTVLMLLLTPSNADTINQITQSKGENNLLSISEKGIELLDPIGENTSGAISFRRTSEAKFTYTERLGRAHDLYIIGGGHCALALSELMSMLDFRITIFDDRPGLNTIEKNRFADEIRIVETYESVGDLIPAGPDVYVVVMTLGYASDEIAIRGLVKKDKKYLGVLGSRAKMKALLKTLEKEGIDPMLLSRIHTPIGLPINSHSPEEIAVSIAAEIISIKNA